MVKAKLTPSRAVGYPPPFVKLKMPPAVDPEPVQLFVPMSSLTSRAMALVPPIAFLTLTSYVPEGTAEVRSKETEVAVAEVELKAMTFLVMV